MSDVDWENNQIQIQRTFNHQTFYETKTETSNRRVDLGPNMMAESKKWWLACPPNKLNLIFPNESGQPMNYSNMIQRFYMPDLKKTKIKADQISLPAAHLLITVDPSGGKHKIHSIPTWAFIANGNA